jgi:hypothetical protein
METAYEICAVVGGTVIACQFLLALFGLGHGHDAGGGGDGHDFGGHDAGGADAAGHDAAGHDAAHHPGQHHHAVNWFFGLLTFRTLVAGVTFFGLTGLMLTRSHADPGLALVGALAAGAAALVIVSSVMRGLSRLNADGTLRIERAVGATGTVYLTIPGERQGAGKVHVSVHQRRVEYKAVTANQPLPTGARVVVTAVVGPDTIEVVPAPVSEEVSHG